MNTNNNKNRKEGDAESTRKRVLSYLRARSDSPTETDAILADQRRACQTACDRLNTESIGEYVDRETSANDRQRPGTQRPTRTHRSRWRYPLRDRGYTRPADDKRR